MDETYPGGAPAAHREYVAEVAELIDEHMEDLSALLEAATQHLPSGAQPLTVRRADHAIIVSQGAREATFPVEAVTDPVEERRLSDGFKTGQARCLPPTDPPEEWVLALGQVGSGTGVSEHRWMGADGRTPLDEETVAAILRNLFP